MSEAQGQTPLEAFPDYCYPEDGRKECVRAWAAEYVDDARIQLISDRTDDIEAAKRDLRAALYILESEID